MTPAATAQLAGWAATLRLQDVPQDVQRIACLALLDWYAVTWAARDEPATRIVRDEARWQGATPASVLVGKNERSSPLLAAWVNGTAGHALDYDDVHNDVPGHATAPVAPAVLALAEARGADGAALLQAFIAGYEATVYVGRALSPGLFRRGYQASTTAGCIGAAVACGRLLGLSAAQLQSAIGLAATQAAGLQATFGSMAKCFAVGKAAQSGLLAASLVGRGFECVGNVLEAPRGFAAVFGDCPTLAEARMGDSSDWNLRRNLFKLHASCFMTHAAMAAAAQLRATGAVIDAAGIESVLICVEEAFHRVVLTPPPRTGLEAKFNLKHCVALVLCGHDTGSPATFGDALTAEPALRALAQRTEVRIDADMTFTAATLTVRMRDGREESLTLDVGEPEQDLDRLEVEVRDKVHKLLMGLDVRRRDRTISAFLRLGELPGTRELHAVPVGDPVECRPL